MNLTPFFLERQASITKRDAPRILPADNPAATGVS